MGTMRNFISDLKNKQIVIFVIAVLLSNQILFRMAKTLLYSLGILKSGTNLEYMIFELSVLVISCLIAYMCKQTHVLQCGTKGLGKGLWSGMVFFVLAVIGCSISISEAIQQGVAHKSVADIVIFVVFVLLVGLAEELLYRGVIADSIFERLGKSASGIWLSVILGGVIFGMSHITNILSGQSVEQTIVQMVAVSMTGILFTAIYVRHKNIYAVAILHALLDFFTLFEKGVWEGLSLASKGGDIDFWVKLTGAVKSQSIFIIVALFVLRPKILKKIVERRGSRQ